MTHAELVSHAARWLAKRHPVVITEIATLGEEPDAIGFRGSHSTLIECKATLADFRADRGKSFRAHPERGIGSLRYFMAPAGLLADEELPWGWGLLECDAEATRETRKPEPFGARNTGHEIEILLSVIRRIGRTKPEGCSIKHYTLETKCRATLGTLDPEDGRT